MRVYVHSSGNGPPSISWVSAGISLSLPAWVSMSRTSSPARIIDLPIISMMEGDKALVSESGPLTSEAAKPRPTVPAHASSAAVALGIARVLP